MAMSQSVANQDEEMALLQEEVLRQEKALHETRDELARLVNEYKRMAQEKADSENEKAQVLGRLNGAVETISKLERGIKSRDGQINQMKAQIARQGKSLSEMRKKLSERKTDPESITNRHKDQADAMKISRLEAEGKTLRAQLRDAAKHHSGSSLELEEFTKASEARYQALQADREALRQTVRELRDEKHALVKELEKRQELEATNQSLKNQLDNLRNGVDANEFKATEDLLLETTEALNEWIREAETLQAEVDERDALLQRMKQEADASKAQVVELSRAVEKQREDLVRLQQESGASETDDSRVIDAVAAAKAELDSVVQTLELELQDAKRKLEDAERGKHDVVAELSKLQGELAQIEKTAQALQLERDELASEKPFYAKKIIQLEDEVNEQKHFVRKYFKQLEETKTELQVSKTVAQSLRAGYAKAEKERGQLLEELQQRDREESALGAWAKDLMRTLSKL